jgi:NAD(P)-dependent dehydrogenase (short-subunit alcohol dehydrogenase family)
MENEITCLVTGATSGIGEAAALELARRGARVILVGRSQEKIHTSIEYIKRETGSSSLSGMLADLASLEQVRRLAEQVLDQHDRLDVLVNNAGTFSMRRMVSADGYEQTFAVNHLSHFLLTNLLLPRIAASAPGRIINVASDSHRRQKLDFGDLNSERSYNGMRAYGRSKLANILFTYELARRLAGTGVTANAVHPGFVATEIYRAVPSWIKPVVNKFAKTPAQGAKTIVYLACAEEAGEVSGKYFAGEKEARSDPASYDEEAARRLWEVSEDIVGSW